MSTAWITGVAGTVLSADERAFLQDARPCGLILFGRNCETPTQVAALIEEFKTAVATDDVIVSIDQEGGRVQRLRAPHWRDLPPGAAYGKLYEADAANAIELTMRAGMLMAAELRELGINTNMVPVLDLPQPGAHEIISDRALGTTPAQVAALGGALAHGHEAAGVLPVMKHIPGHGRALADSHLELPVVDASKAELRAHDFAPFAKLKNMPAAMTAHVVYSAFDADHPASTSAIIHRDVIRDEIGFQGLLMSDDLSMKALSGDYATRTRAVLDAGSDLVLHCNGKLDEMREIAGAVPELSGRALKRFNEALDVTRTAIPVDVAAAEAAIAAGLAVAT